MSDSLVSRAIAVVDAANSEDPNTVTFAGVAGPKELVHSQRMTYWLERLAPDPTDAQQIAARAHHLRRWEFPRAAYPEGRAGYLKWRKDARGRHSELVSALLSELDAPPELGTRVSEIIQKTDIKGDPQVQTHEDALCLVFFELQAEAVAPSLGDKALPIVEKTVAKMSDHARDLAADISIAPAIAAIIAR